MIHFQKTFFHREAPAFSKKDFRFSGKLWYEPKLWI